VCGIVGMKPTFGAVRLDGCFPLSFSLDHFGTMTRKVHENAVALSYFLEPSAARRMGCEPRSALPFPDLHRGLRGLRVGVIDSFHRGAGVNPEIAATTDAALETLKAEGAQMRTLELSALSVFTECGKTILQSEAFTIHADWLRTRQAEYGTRGRRRLLVGALIPAERYVKAQQIRAALTEQFVHAMRGLDVAVCASSLELPCAIDDEALVDQTYDKQARTPFNVLGVPAISIPAGLSSKGLPIGFQIAGKPYGEGVVYRAALGLEAALALPMRPPLEGVAAAG
jgi:aspartyl-tRNA(Asn)/glutamyl-tRNA(Gln) amidotransferase subunit A